MVLPSMMPQCHCIALRSDDSPTCFLDKAETATMMTAVAIMTVVDIVVMVDAEVVAVREAVAAMAASFRV